MSGGKKLSRNPSPRSLSGEPWRSSTRTSDTRAAATLRWLFACREARTRRSTPPFTTDAPCVSESERRRMNPAHLPGSILRAQDFNESVAIDMFDLADTRQRRGAASSS